MLTMPEDYFERRKAALSLPSIAIHSTTSTRLPGRPPTTPKPTASETSASN